MPDEKQISDSDWVRIQRLESDRKAWLWSRLRFWAGWIGGALTGTWVSIDAVTKFIHWIQGKPP